QVAGGSEALVPGADLRAGTRHATRKRHDHTRQSAHRRDRPLGRGEYRRARSAEDQEIAAADGLLLPDRILAEELAVHHGNAPVAPAVNLLRRLLAVDEIPQHASEREGLAAVDAAVACGAGASEHALPNAVAHGLGKPVPAHAKHQQCDTW